MQLFPDMVIRSRQHRQQFPCCDRLAGGRQDVQNGRAANRGRSRPAATSGKRRPRRRCSLPGGCVSALLAGVAAGRFFLPAGHTDYPCSRALCRLASRHRMRAQPTLTRHTARNPPLSSDRAAAPAARRPRQPEPRHVARLPACDVFVLHLFLGQLPPAHRAPLPHRRASTKRSSSTGTSQSHSPCPPFTATGGTSKTLSKIQPKRSRP